MFSAYLLFPKISGTWWNTKVEDIDVLSMFINSFLTFRDLTENFKFCWEKVLELVCWRVRYQLGRLRLVLWHIESFE